MKRYLAFYGDCFYPSGGMDDFIGDFDEKEDAIIFIAKTHINHRPDDLKWEFAFAKVWDTENMIEVYNIENFIKV